MDRIKAKISSIDDRGTIAERISAEKFADLGLKDITLRPYQLEGANWMIQRFHRKHGCILGDEMGLGKTCQTISLLVYILGSELECSEDPALVVSPLSVMGNWQDELKRFAPHLKVVSYTGDKEYRGELRHELRSMENVNVILTTYEICLKDESFFQKFSWSALIVDEAHRLKNQNSLLHQSLKELDIRHIVLLTGTPIQNNLRELFALLSFVAPRVFRPSLADKFVETYEDMSDDHVKDELHSMLLPFLLRRTKNEVVLDLPKKTEVILFHGLTALQKKLYKAILTKDHAAFEQNVDMVGMPRTRTSLMNTLMQLRKCVNHPYIFDGVEPEPFELGEHLVDCSGKLHLLDKLLMSLWQQGHKVLLFSQMTRMLDILQDYLGFRGYEYERLDGSVRGEERYLAVKNFNQRDDTFVFLLSTKAGGQGLNLVGADTVIFVDSDYNPQNDLQAAARAHRIGQTRPVKIIRLIGRDSVEELILQRADEKLKLTNDVIEGGKFSLGTSNSGLAGNATQLADMLKFGLDKILQSEESSVKDLDLEEILGASAGGEWMVDERKDEEDKEEEKMEDDEGSDEEKGHMYMFEGKDYSKETSAADKKAFDEMMSAQIALIEEEAGGSRTMRKGRGQRGDSLEMMSVLPTVARKRKQLTEEEKAERKKKREENAAKRAKLMEEAEMQRAEERRRRLKDMWEARGYESSNVAMETEEDEDDEASEDGNVDLSGDAEDVGVALRYVRGDVTHPINTGDQDAIVVHCVDDSGSWGHGGLFSALARRSPQPERLYELAGKMRDLNLGDAHLVPIDDVVSREAGKDWVALIVAQHRDKNNHLSGIKLTALDKGLQRLYKAAKKCNGTVHLPRIGHSTPAFNWYGTERLIRKHLASRGVPTSIYYYPRKGSKTKRPSPQDDDDEDTKPSSHAARSHSNEDDDDEDAAEPSCSSHKRTKQEKKTDPSRNQEEEEEAEKKSGLAEFLSGLSACIHKSVDGEKERKKLRRYIIAHNGDVHEECSDKTTHLLVSEGFHGDLSDVDKFPSLKVVTADWLWDSVAKQRKQPERDYVIS
ncbi:chromodomain-helicase-DNA-binding protein 1-like isoform X1 [Strongylocentrotus purpuratus]|uniref:Chromodomain-helicase-DNA-binding protein 1-like n=1 Tax=Strongylocentrotus purpuratus TaxID=7668 RepID=A0A7M7NLP8_STRPU|nr:chromodomain-helicase-DNA-binding protein 1-like isoform X1 [Strongylocentrotus purpuratus]